MLVVKTRVAPSPIHGLGLFAEEFIPEGTPVWKFAAGFDRAFSAEELEAFPPSVHIFMAKYSYLSKRTKRYLLDVDNARFFNHSTTPNTTTRTVAGEEEDVIVALRDIEAGEELTINYSDQEGDIEEGNVIDRFYERYHLVDEVDPRQKDALKA